MNVDAQQKEITLNHQISDLSGRLQRAETAYRECSENKDKVITELEQRHAAKTTELVEQYAAKVKGFAMLEHLHAAKIEELEQMNVDAQQKEITFNHQISDLTASLELAESNHSESVNCVICKNGRRAISFSPCHHMCCCETCASDQRLDNKCPMCRADITSKKTTFW
jgi:L-lactate utilization protein LutC